MISCPSIEKRVIRSHYDLATPFYRLFWGRHIHHGLWEGSESPAEAQLKLTDTVIREAGLDRQKKDRGPACSTSAAAWEARPSTWPKSGTAT